MFIGYLIWIKQSEIKFINSYNKPQLKIYFHLLIHYKNIQRDFAYLGIKSLNS